ncbi:MAG: hypothetical protein EXR99_03420 [Gemmataceae bacterium]|nr:hypothetical protein [Gemmataceae bacterium]
MSRLSRMMFFGFLFSFGAMALVGSSRTTIAFFEDNNEIKAAVVKLSKKLDSKGVAELTKKYSLDELMQVFKLRTKGGLGVGEKAGAISPDGIEAKLQGLQKKAPDKSDLAKNGKAYAAIGEISLVLAEIADTHPDSPKEKKGEKDPKKWKEFVGKMKEGAKDLVTASNKGDSPGVKTAAKILNDSCIECHGIFR